MIPCCDLVFLRNVVLALNGRTMQQYHPGSRRCAAALILRFGETDGVRVGGLFARRGYGSLGCEEALSILEQNCDVKQPHRGSELRLLFMQRTNWTSDRWSGQVALPGGRRDPEDDNDFACVRRETYDELGIPLDSPEFVLLGRMEDYTLTSRELTVREDEGAVQSRFVFLHVGDLTPSVKLATHEIQAVRWLPLRTLLDKTNVERGRVVHHLLHFVPYFNTDMGSLVRDAFPTTHLAFPSLSIAEEGGAPWRVWGVALRSVSELVEIGAKVEPLDWPMFSSNSFVIEYLCIRPYHAWRLLTDSRFASMRFQEFETYHLWLIVSGLIVLSIVHSVLSVVHVICFSFLIAFGVVDDTPYMARGRFKQAEIVDARSRRADSGANDAFIEQPVALEEVSMASDSGVSPAQESHEESRKIMKTEGDELSKRAALAVERSKSLSSWRSFDEQNDASSASQDAMSTMNGSQDLESILQKYLPQNDHPR